MVRQVGSGAVVPFGIGIFARQPRAVERFGRQVEIEAEAGGRPPLALAERHVVELVGGAGIVVVAVVAGAVDIDHLGHRQDLLEAVEDEGTALALALLRRLALRNMAAGLRRKRRAARRWLVVLPASLALGAQQRIRPERHRQHRQVARRRAVREDDGHRLVGKSRAFPEKAEDAVLDMALDGRQRPGKARLQRRGAKPAIAPDEARKGGEHGLRRRLGAPEHGEVALQRIALGDRFERHHRHGGGKPDVEVPVEAAVGEEVDFAGQHQRGVIAAGLDELLLAEPHALAQPEAMRRRAPAGRRDLHRTLPAEAAEADGEHRPHVFQTHGMVGMARPTAGLAHQPVPGPADGFLELQEIQHGRPQRIIASATSRRAARTSGSSVSGSIIAARTAPRTSMPLSIRQAQ